MVSIPIKQILLASPHLFMKEVFKYRSDGIHSDFIDHMESCNRVLLLAPRGHGKSKVAQSMIAWEMIKDPNIRIILVSDTHTKAIMFLSGIKRVLETSDVIKNIFGDVVGNVWRDNAVTLVGRTENHVEPTCIAMGAMSGAVTGLHADLIILDDVVSFDSSRSSVQTERLENWFKTTLLPTLMPGGKIIVLGTRYSPNDLYHTLKGMGYDTKVFPAITSNGEALCSWLQPLEDEYDDNGALVKIGLINMKKQLGSIIFALQMMNDTSLLAENNIIRAAWIKYYETAPDNIKDIIISVDPAIGLKSENDFTAIGVWCRDDDNNIYLLDQVNKRITFNETIITIQRLINGFRPDRVVVEDVAYQKALIQELIRKCGDTVITGVKPPADKRARLINVSNYFENGLVHFRPQSTDMVDQLLYFPAQHDDLVDMLSLGLGWYKEHDGLDGVIIW